MIQWQGGIRPSEEGNPLVRVVFRDGVSDKGLIGNFEWRHYGSPYDIIAYELVTPLDQAGLGDSHEALTFGPIDKCIPQPSLDIFRRCVDETIAKPLAEVVNAGGCAPPVIAANNDGGGLGKVGNPKDVAADNRVPLWLLSTVAKIHWALAQFAGLLKYGAWNWRIAGVRYSVYLSAMERHIEGLKNGEEYDPIDGTRHEGNIMACAAILMDARAAGKLIDDRPPRVDHRPAIAEAEALIPKLREKYKDRNPRHFTIADSQEAA